MCSLLLTSSLSPQAAWFATHFGRNNKGTTSNAGAGEANKNATPCAAPNTLANGVDAIAAAAAAAATSSAVVPMDAQLPIVKWWKDEAMTFGEYPQLKPAG